jgi:hypothetical protein
MLRLFGHSGPAGGKLMIPRRCQFNLNCVTNRRYHHSEVGTAIANQKGGTTRRLLMKTHIMTALLALVISACASHQRDVASVQDDPTGTPHATGQAQQPVVDGVSSRGDHF